VIEHHPMFTDDNVLGVNVNMAELKHIMWKGMFDISNHIGSEIKAG
jgi:hypothetical protein